MGEIQARELPVNFISQPQFPPSLVHPLHPSHRVSDHSIHFMYILCIAWVYRTLPPLSSLPSLTLLLVPHLAPLPRLFPCSLQLQLTTVAPQASVSARRSVLARSEAPKRDRKLSFDMNKNAGIGFQSEDSAGQTNIFAVEPKAYLAKDNSVAGKDVIGVGILAAVGLLGFGFAGLGGLGGTGAEDLTMYSTVAQYAAAFAAEVAA